MYPLNVILVGCSEDAGRQVRRELARQTARLEADCPDIAGLVQHERLASERPERLAAKWTGGAVSPEKRRLYIYHLKSRQDLRDLQWLSATFVSQPVLALLQDGNEEVTVIQAMREGASQVVQLPLDADDFQSALNRIAVAHRVDAAAGRRGRAGRSVHF